MPAPRCVVIVCQISPTDVWYKLRVVKGLSMLWSTLTKVVTADNGVLHDIPKWPSQVVRRFFDVEHAHQIAIGRRVSSYRKTDSD